MNLTAPMAFGSEALSDLVDASGQPCVSLFAPMHRAGAQTPQNPIRFKNVLRIAEEKLAAGGRRAADIEQLLRPATALLDNSEFWGHQDEGLAVYMSPGLFRPYSLPLQIEDLVVVHRRFHLKPVLALLQEGRFCVLALSQNKVRVFECTRTDFGEIQLPDMPLNLEDALKYDQAEAQLQFHTGTAARGGDRPTMFHGHGFGVDDQKDRLLRYYRAVDRVLYPWLRDQRLPLVLAGVGSVLSAFRKVSTHRQMFEREIAGSPDERSPAELHAEAWNIVREHLEAERADAAARFERLLSMGQASNDLAVVVPAARTGRVSALFVPLDVQVWGRFHNHHHEVQITSEADTEAQDLLDVAAVDTLTTGGEVYAVRPGAVPGDNDIAALFRY